jgi:hypothetical protein
LDPKEAKTEEGAMTVPLSFGSTGEDWKSYSSSKIYGAIFGNIEASAPGRRYDVEIPEVVSNALLCGVSEDEWFFLSSSRANPYVGLQVFASTRHANADYRPKLVIVTEEMVTPAAMTARARSSGGRSSGGLSAWLADLPSFDLTRVGSAFFLFSPIAALVLIAAAAIAVSNRSTRMGHW